METEQKKWERLRGWIEAMSEELDDFSNPYKKVLEKMDKLDELYDASSCIRGNDDVVQKLVEAMFSTPSLAPEEIVDKAFAKIDENSEK